MEIITLEGLLCSCSPKLGKIIEPLLSFTAVYYKETQYKKIRKEYPKTTILKGKNDWYFYSGFLNKVTEYLTKKKIPYKITGEFEKIKPKRNTPILKDIEFRPDQIKLIENFMKSPRGVIQAVTGMGKTIIGMGIVSLYDNKKVLWLCHTKDLMNQTYDEFVKKGFKKVGRIGDGHIDENAKIVIATRQSFINYAINTGYLYDLVIVDEVHHVNSFDSQYGKILVNVLAPIRLGLTATLPDNEEGKLAVEGLIGPVVGSLSIQEGNELGIVAKPRIKIVKIPESLTIKEIKRYQEAYEKGIVKRTERNIIIADIITEQVKKGESVLVIVNRIDHGSNILEQIPEEIKADFIHGNTDSDTRNEVKEALENKALDCAICTTIWKEGISIRSLNCIINAGGGKSEIATLQAIGRGLRTTEDKKEVTIIDFFDPSNKYFISHFGERISLYCDMKWI
jgi:superfamily II DNA or RNA helicase